ncbi:hypothetical protein SAMN04487895_10875 [Paenibacillus sophorae]|uniref:Uncharacterized protein n=1 Tax=Paenibacillus sophorae TaxID=1333845 RepID=A0A1H8Q549_9BACL|nr:hypothetical protein [Paenibacillus sophorae]QWU15263.1 hypothetical protein KP014_25835 [Paenibacillus sophorae]SEO49372.1 hypothetical protein SAMN04487895_10875 [Paenibacillus sophorae]
MELVNRYIHAVTHRLTGRQREDIKRELQGLIEDMLEERTEGRDASAADVEEVLLELGDPQKLADQYRGYGRYLISPEVFGSYLAVLKIVLLSIGIALTVASAFQMFTDPMDALGHFLDFLASLFMGFIQGFAWVTLAFGLIEYSRAKRIRTGIRAKSAWKPADLPPLPDHRLSIKRSNPIASLILTILLGLLFTSSLNLFGVWHLPESGSMKIVPIFDETVFRGFLPLILAVFALSIMKDILKMAAGKWTPALIGFEILVSLLHFVLALFMFNDSAIWNPDFMRQMAESGITPAGSEAFYNVSSIWSRTTEGFIYLIGIVILADIIAAAVKAYRFRTIVRR